MHTIAIDCGASFIKGAVFMEDGKMLKKVQYHAPALHKDSNIMEPVQITELLRAIKKLLRKLTEEESNGYKLCISNEMHGFLLADADGTPVTDYISWQKEYGDIVVKGHSAIEEIRENIDTEDILYTGMELRNSLPSCNLLYLWKRGLLQRRNEEIYFYTLGDYILRELSGLEPVCHPTNAAATGLYDLRTGKWNKNLIKRYQDNGIIFPKIGCTCISFKWGGISYQAYPAIGDQQAALLGAGLHSENAISFNLGTGAQVTRLTRSTERTSAYQIRPYFDNYYLMTIPHLPSGRALNVYFRFIKEMLRQFGLEEDDEQIWNKIIQAEKNAEDTEIKCDLSFFENPLTSSERGCVENIGEYELTMGNLFRAVFRQMSDNFVKAADRLCDGQVRIQKLVFSGGIARRMEAVRNGIIGKYGKDINYIVAQDETLQGLYIYSTERA